MKTTMKKLLSFVLVAVLLVSAIPFQASAAADTIKARFFVSKDKGGSYTDMGVVEKTPGNGSSATVGDLAKYWFINKQADPSKYAFDHAQVFKGNGGVDVSASDTINVDEAVQIYIIRTVVSASDPSDEEKPETGTVQPITMKLLFDDSQTVAKTLTHTPSNGVSSTIIDLLDYVYDANWAETYEFVRANNSRLGTTDNINSGVLAGESINVRLKTKAQEVQPINVVVKVESSDNVVWTGSKVPSNGTSSKVEDLLSYCWNKDWDDVYKFDHVWSHEQQKNVALSGSVNAGDTLYIMVNKLDGTNSTAPSNGTTYTVTFYDVNNAEITSVKVASGNKVHVSNFEDAAKYTNIGSGYTFAGWKVGKNGTTTYTNSQAAGLAINGNTSFYAVATKASGTTTNKFPYKVYLHIFKDNKVDDPAKTIDITNGIALDGKVTLAEVKSVVKNYYTAKTSDGIGYDGMYLAKGNWVGNFVNDTQKYETIEDTNEMRKESEVHINVMITNANAKSSSSSTADPSNPKTGDSITMTMTVMTISASALALVYFFNKKRAIVK